MNPFRPQPVRTVRSVGTAILLAAAAATGHAASVVGDEVRVVNSFEDATLTGGAQAFFGEATATVVDGVDLPAFIGFYDIDIDADGAVFTLIDNSGATDTVIPAGRYDRYYVAFDSHEVDAIRLDGIDGLNANASVALIAPGTTLPLVEAPFSPSGLPIVFPNGGFVLSFGEGTDLTQLGVQARVNFEVSPVPEPATAGLLGLGLAAVAAMKQVNRRRRGQTRA